MVLSHINVSLSPVLSLEVMKKKLSSGEDKNNNNNKKSWEVGFLNFKL